MESRVFPGRRAGEQAVQVGRSREEQLGSLSSMFLTSWCLLFLFNSILLKLGLSIPWSFFDVSWTHFPFK